MVPAEPVPVTLPVPVVPAAPVTLPVPVVPALPVVLPDPVVPAAPVPVPVPPSTVSPDAQAKQINPSDRKREETNPTE